MKLSATTVMMPQFDLRETAECLAGLGFDGAEWRCRHISEAQQGQPYSPWGNVKNDLSPDNLAERGEELVCVSEELGLGIAGLGGHTPGSTMFAVAVNGRLWLFSGDTTNSKADLLSDTGKGFLYSYLMVPEDTARTGELRRWFAGLDAKADMQVVVSHDLADIEASDLRRWAIP